MAEGVTLDPGMPLVDAKPSNIATVIYLDRSICVDDTCRASIDDMYLYRDTGHLSNQGSAWLAESPIFQAALAQALYMP